MPSVHSHQLELIIHQSARLTDQVCRKWHVFLPLSDGICLEPTAHLSRQQAPATVSTSRNFDLAVHRLMNAVQSRDPASQLLAAYFHFDVDYFN